MKEHIKTECKSYNDAVEILTDTYLDYIPGCANLYQVLEELWDENQGAISAIVCVIQHWYRS